MSRFVLLAAVLLFTGCQATRYEPTGKAGSFGYSSERISERRLAVTFQGNSATDYAQAWDFALLRAAELTREMGGTHFRIITGRNLIQVDNRPQWSGPITGGNAITGSREYPAVQLEIEYYPAAPTVNPGQAILFDAAETSAALLKKYHLNPPVRT